MMLHRMFHRDLCSDYMRSLGEERNHQMLITASPVLCSAIRAKYESMRSTALRNFKNKQERNTKSQDPGKFIFPSELFNCEESPLIMTYAELLKSLDCTLPLKFYDQNNINHQIDFVTFQDKYFPSICSKQRCAITADIAFTELLTTIKGSVKSLISPAGHISKDDFVDLSSRKGSFLSSEDRILIYGMFEKYERMRKANRAHDLADVVHYIYTNLSKHPYGGPLMNNVYIDEVQDLSPAQISLFKFICKNPDGFVFAGDTAQTITQGVGFRFEAVKDLFYEEILGADKQYKVPKLQNLSKNFRTHSGIVNAAGLIVSLIVHFFPYTIDKLTPESSTILGPLPILLRDTTDLISKLFDRGEMLSAEFGSEQAILVRDEITKEQLSKRIGTSALVLTCAECKGMEFTDVLVYNFFKSGGFLRKWRFLLNFGDDTSSGQYIPPFNEKEHAAFCRELKMLYVLFTRAKECLIIYDEDTDSRDVILKLLRDRNLIEEKLFDSGIHTLLKEKGTPEQWCTRGHEFMSRGDYANARVSFFRGNDHRNERLAYALAEKTRAYWLETSNPVEARNLFIEAAEVFVFLGDRHYDAAECFEHGHVWGKAGDEYIIAQCHKNAAICYKNAKMWKSAALAFAQSDLIEDAIECTLLCLDFGLVEQIVRSSSLVEEDQTDVLSRTHYQFAKAFHMTGDEESMMKHVFQFKSKYEQKKFLERRGHFRRLFELDLANGDYNDAALALCRNGDYHPASKYFRQGGNYHMAHKCLLKLARFEMYGEDMNIIHPLSSKGESYIEEISLEHASSETLIECDILRKLPLKNTEDAVSLLDMTKPYPRLTLILCNSVYSFLSEAEVSSLDGMTLSVVHDSVLDCGGKLLEVTSKAMKKLSRTRLSENEKCLLESVCAFLEGSLSFLYSDDVLFLDRVTSFSKFERTSGSWTQAMESFQRLIHSIVEGIGIKIVKVIFRAIMRSDPFSVSKSVQRKIVSPTERIELRLKLKQVTTTFDYLKAATLSEEERKLVHFNQRNVVEELFPPLPSSEDIDKFVNARKAFQMSKLENFLDARSCNYDATARMFLIADLTGAFDALLMGEWHKKLQIYLEAFCRDQGYNYDEDHRVGLIWSMQFEQAFCNLDFRSNISNLPMQFCNIYNSVDSAAYFIMGQFHYIFRGKGLSIGMNEKELPVSPFHLLAIAERYVCLALLYRKKGKKEKMAMMPRSLAMFVFHRRSRFLGDMLRALHSKRDYFHPGQKAFYRTAIKIADVFIDILSMGLDNLRHWFSSSAKLGKGPLYDIYKISSLAATLPAFVLRSAQLVSTVILNEGPHDDSRNSLLNRFASAWTDRRLLQGIPDPYIKYLNSLKGISKAFLKDFPLKSSQINDKIIFLTVWSSGKELPKFVGGNISHHVVYLNESNYSDDVRISDVEMLDSSTKARLTYSDATIEDEPEPDDVEIQRLPPPAEILHTRKSFKEECEIIFVRKLTEARKRCATFTPLDFVKRWLERQFISRNMRRVDPVVEQFVTSIAPVLQLMDDITEAIDRFAASKDVRVCFYYLPIP